ncbi:hypothetical protein GRI39_05065 [Altererythrobacter indicus]|uniref:Thymidylate kinase n=1 Tax=Altericroceibacterium indicum TaxID=374177 RepID=A0A845A846_9SPHN|nr:hypothetical protein [Altericroceibacterium indicum]MXP25413.1 hypothetical protein [Altericroceibacterium indicum]
MTKHHTRRELIGASPINSELVDYLNQARSPSHNQLAPCVALIGCDGSGKSTLARDLVSLLNRNINTRSVYLGLGTGDFGRRIAKLPLVGGVVSRFLQNKASKAHEGRDKRLPGLATALAMFGLSLTRRHRFREALKYRKKGVQIVTDRYPQAELAGGFDGPGLNSARKGSPLVEYLARREQSIYRQMAAYQPTVIIRLNVDVDTALARKADHERALLEKKIAVLPTLSFAGARIVDIDATRPYGDVLASTLAVLQRFGLRA